MPQPDEALEKVRTVTVDVPKLGRVDVTCVLRNDARANKRYWSALRADPAR